MTGAELAAELSAGTVRAGYLVAGSEPLLRDDALAAIEAAVLGSGARDFDLDRLEVGRLPVGRLEEALERLPLLAPRRLVVLRESEGRGPRLDGAWADTLERWIRDAPAEPGSVLVVVTTRADKRTRWVKAFAAKGAIVDCEAPTRARDLARFLEAEAARQGVGLAGEAAGLLADRIGPQLLMLRQELEKAALLAGPGARIEREHVALAVADVAEEPIWDLTDAIGEGRTADALEGLARLLAQGAAPPAILGALASHLRRLVRVGSGERVPGPPFVVRKLEQQARRLSARRGIACLRAIHRADVELKGAGVQRPERALEQLVLTLAS